MKFSEILAFSAAFAVASAAPMKRSGEVEITFHGAAGAQFTQKFPTDNSYITINNALSISKISSGADGVECTFIGVDNSHTIVEGTEEVDVGPPQTQVSGTCHIIPYQRRSESVTVTFIGAADAKFTKTFPTDNTVKYIDNELSVSHIEVDRDGVTCTFEGVDDAVTTVTGPDTVDVGPPQTQLKGKCSAN